MKLEDLFEQLAEVELEEAKISAWGRDGNKVVRKFRCPTGKRKGRLVTDITKCSQPIDIKKRQTLKKTKAAKASRISRKSKKTKKYNPAAKRAAAMNKRLK